MRRYRVIPSLLLRARGLVKTVRFRNPTYLGDPVNAIRIFNEKEVDELVFLDIEATINGRDPDLPMLNDIASECFMPLCYGGGVSRLPQIEQLLRIGVEKIAINSALVHQPELVQQAVREFGSSTIVASIDYRKGLFGRTQVFTHSGTRGTGRPPVEIARHAEELGAGEILLNSIDRDGTLEGYDVDTIHQVSDAVSVPVIAAGGAGSLADFRSAIVDGHASAVAAGAMFVFHGRHRAVLISYPTQQALQQHLS